MTALPTADVLFEEASGWYFRLHAEDLTPAEMDAFAAWLGQGQAQAFFLLAQAVLGAHLLGDVLEHRGELIAAGRKDRNGK